MNGKFIRTFIVTNGLYLQIKDISSNYNISKNDTTINCISSNISVNLLQTSTVIKDGASQIFFIKNSSSGDVFITPFTNEFIENSVNLTLPSKHCISIQATNNNWIII